MDAPTLVTAVDREVAGGDEIRLSITPPAGAVNLVIHRKTITATVWTTSTVVFASTVDVTGLTSGRVYEFVVVAEDASGDYSLPSAPLRAIPTTGEGTISRRIEENILSAMETITTGDGHFDDVDNVYRMSYVLDVEAETGLFFIVGFDSIEKEFAAHMGSDVIDECTMEIFIAAGRKGRDGTVAWIPDSIHEMLAAAQIAVMEDRSRAGLAIDTVPDMDTLRPESLKGMAEAVCAKKITVTYRTPRTDPHSSAL